MKVFNSLFDMLQQTRELHVPNSAFYKFTSQACETIINQSSFSKEIENFENFGYFGSIAFPYFSMGNIDSLKLFGLDELILFAFYHSKQKDYKKVADMGANIGLHSLLMARLGWEVCAFEPDPEHIKRIQYQLKLNQVNNVNINENAISDCEDTLTFTRLEGNRTGSHLKGEKSEVYGEVTEFSVDCLAFNKLMRDFDFIKMDIEGAEAKAICSTSIEDWRNTDVMLEVGSPENAEMIWQHITSLGLFGYSQKAGWDALTDYSAMPKNYKEGSLFISAKNTGVFTAVNT